MTAHPFSRRSALRRAGAFGMVAVGGARLGDASIPRGAKALSDLATPPTYAPVSRRPRYRRATGSQQFQPGHGWTAAGGGTASVDLDDTSVFVRGSQSVRGTTKGDDKQPYIRRTGMTELNLTGKMVRVIFRAEDTATHTDSATVTTGRWYRGARTGACPLAALQSAGRNTAATLPFGGRIFKP
ncbi:hypothetical protein AB0L75_25045 [Streptomyces sp. NPDC052101]|uniref:hypothetical protein n=1 Tax=Streptomyces sp. NPDC052101 TaxID=3155763 RepID=UPI003412B3B5